MKVPPMDVTSSAEEGRMSLAETRAPSRFAVPIACSPATPTPSTSTRAGGTVPGCGHVEREEAGQADGGFEDAAVAGHEGLRGEGVHGLGTGDARHEFQREGRDPTFGERPDGGSSDDGEASPR
jgi:hypothetical protein